MRRNGGNRKYQTAMWRSVSTLLVVASQANGHMSQYKPKKQSTVWDVPRCNGVTNLKFCVLGTGTNQPWCNAWADNCRIETDKLVEHYINSQPVSYTHLDVYKRQFQ